MNAMIYPVDARRNKSARLCYGRMVPSPADDEARDSRDDGEVPIEAQLEEHLPAIRAFVRASAGPGLRATEEVEDLAQSVCREVLEHADRFQHAHDDGFRRWLFLQARRKILGRARSQRAAQREGRAIDVGSRAGALEEILVEYRSFTTPSARVSLVEQVESVERALDDLPEDQRQVVVLAHLAQWSRREIADELGRSEGAVRMLLHRGIAALAIALASETE